MGGMSRPSQAEKGEQHGVEVRARSTGIGWGGVAGLSGSQLAPHSGVSAVRIAEEYHLPRKHIQGLEKAPKAGKRK